MKFYLIVTRANRIPEKILVPPGKVLVCAVQPGDDLQVVDVEGEYVNGQVVPDGEALRILLSNGSEIHLDHFYSSASDDQSDPITVTLRLEDDASDEFNDLGNLAGVHDITLIRDSNTGYIKFHEQLRRLANDVPLDPSSSSFSSSASEPAADLLPLTLDNLVQTSQSQSVPLDLLANDYDPDGDLFSPCQMNRQILETGEPISFFCGPAVTPLGKGEVECLEWDAGETVRAPFIHPNFDDSGHVSLASASIEHSENDAIEAKPEFDEGGETNTKGSEVNVDLGNDFEGQATGEPATPVLTGAAPSPDGEKVNETVAMPICATLHDPAKAVDDLATTSENRSVILDLLANDGDVDLSDTYRICGVEIDGSMTVIIAGVPLLLPSGAQLLLLVDGTVNYTPPTWTGALHVGAVYVDSFVYKIDDGLGGVTTATATITIEEEDLTDTDPNVDGTAEDAPATVAMLSNESNPEARDNPLSGWNLTQPPAGTADFKALDAEETQLVTCTYDVTTPDGGTVTEMVTLKVNGVNDAPAMIHDSAMANENATVAIDKMELIRDRGGNSSFIPESKMTATASVTISFSHVVEDPVIQINLLGGASQDGVENAFPDVESSFKTEWDAGSIKIKGRYSSLVFTVTGVGPEAAGRDGSAMILETKKANVALSTVDGLVHHTDPESSEIPVDDSGGGQGETATETLTDFVQNENRATDDEPFEQMAWASQDESVLIYDDNESSDGTIGEEFAFSDYSEVTHAIDLEGLTEAFENNENGLLSAEDEDWARPDADGEGWGHGDSEVIHSDGRIGPLADAAFIYEEFSEQDQVVITGAGQEINQDAPESMFVMPVESGVVILNHLADGGGGGLSPDLTSQEIARATSLIFSEQGAVPRAEHGKNLPSSGEGLEPGL